MNLIGGCRYKIYLSCCKFCIYTHPVNSKFTTWQYDGKMINYWFIWLKFPNRIIHIFVMLSMYMYIPCKICTVSLIKDNPFHCQVYHVDKHAIFPRTLYKASFCLLQSLPQIHRKIHCTEIVLTTCMYTAYIYNMYL